MKFKSIEKEFENFSKNEPENFLDFDECPFTHYKFKMKNKMKSIVSYFRQMSKDRFFILMNRSQIKELYETENMSTRQIMNFLIQNNYIKKPITNFISAINNTDIQINVRDKSQSIINSSNVMLKNTLDFYKKKFDELNISYENLSDTEIRKKYKNIILSPFYLRKNKIEWEEIERKNLTKFDDSTKEFIENFVENNCYDFENYFYKKSQNDILCFNEGLMKILGKKIWNYFGKDVIFQELKSFYKKLGNNKRYLRLKHFNKSSKNWNYFGNIDGRTVLSMSEAKIVSILLDNKIEVLTNNWYDIKSKKYMYDIYLPNNNFYIEYLGMMDNENYKNNIQDKKEYCKQNNFDVLFSDNIEEIFKKIEDKLKMKIDKKILYPITILEV